LFDNCLLCECSAFGGFFVRMISDLIQYFASFVNSNYLHYAHIIKHVRCTLQHMTVNDIISVAAKQLGIDISCRLVLCCFWF